MPRYISGNFKKTPFSGLSSDRYRYLSPGDAEPSLGDPISPGDSPPVGTQYQIVSVPGYPGSRYWVPVGGGLIPGSISVYDENNLVGGLNSTTQLNFTGLAVSAIGHRTGLPNPGIAVTVTIFAPGNNGELLFNQSNDFGTSSKLKFDTTTSTLNSGDRITVGTGGTIITTTGIGSVGIGTIDPSQKLHVQGNARITGTIYDYNNDPGSPTNILAKNNFGGLSWIDQGTIRSGAGGTYQNVQFHNNTGLVDGAPNFVYDELNQRVGIGSTKPTVLLDVRGSSKFTGAIEINNLNVTGVATVSTLGVTGTTTTRNLQVTGVTTLGFVTGSNAYFSGIITAARFVGSVELTDLNVTGIATVKNLGATGIITTRDLTVYESTNLNRLNVSGVSTLTSINASSINVSGAGTVGNFKLESNTLSTLSGNMVIDASGGTLQVNDSLYVNNVTESTSKTTGSIIAGGGIGVEKNLYVGGSANLATQGGITTTGGDLYVGNNLYIKGSTNFDQIGGNVGIFTAITTGSLNATGISTLSRLNVNSNASFSGVSTFINDVTLGDTSSNRVTFRSLVGSGITPSVDNTYQLGTQSNRWSDVYANRFNGSFIGNADTTTRLQTPREIDISGDVIGVGIGTTFDGSRNVVIPTELSTTGVTSATYGSATQVARFSVDAKGRITSASNVGIDFTLANALTAERVGVGTTTGSGSYPLVFVDSNNSARDYESLYTDESLSYNPNTNRVVVSAIQPTSIFDGISTSGSSDQVITANGTGGWTWKAVSGVPASTVSTGSTVGVTSHYLTFVQNNNSPRANENVYTDLELSYNPSSNQLNVSKLNVYNQVSSNLIPDTNGTLNLGSPTNRWNNIYGTVVGTLSGSASSISVINDNQAGSRYLVLSSTNTNGGITSAYVDSNLLYDANTDVLTASKIKPTNIVDSSDSSGSNNQIILSNAGSWSWTNVSSLNITNAGYANTAGIATNLRGTTVNVIAYQAGINSTSFLSVGSTGQLLSSNGGATPPSWVDVNNLTAANANYASRAGIATNIAGLGTNVLIYQTGNNTTAFLTPGSSGQLLQSNGNSSAPSWVTASNLSVSKAGYADSSGISTNLRGGPAFAIPYQSSVDNTTFLSPGTSGQILQSGGPSAAPSWVNVTGLSVNKAGYADTAGISTNLKGGTAFAIPYQSTIDSTAFLSAGSAGQILQSGGASAAPSWVNVGVLTAGKAGYADTAGISTNLRGGTTYAIPYQASANNTTFLSAGSTGQILQSGGASAAPTWITPIGVSGSATSITVLNDNTNAVRYPLFSSTNVNNGLTSSYVDTNLTYNPGTDVLGVGSISASYIGVSTIKPGSLVDKNNSRGDLQQLLVSDGNGSWVWTNSGVSTSVGLAGTTNTNETVLSNGDGTWRWGPVEANNVKNIPITRIVSTGSTSSVGFSTNYSLALTTDSPTTSFAPRTLSSLLIIRASIPMYVTLAINSSGYTGANVQIRRRIVGGSTTVLSTHSLTYCSQFQNGTYLFSPVCLEIFDNPNTLNTVVYEVWIRSLIPGRSAYMNYIPGVNYFDGSNSGLSFVPPTNFWPQIETPNTQKSTISVSEYPT